MGVDQAVKETMAKALKELIWQRVSYVEYQLVQEPEHAVLVSRKVELYRPPAEALREGERSCVA